MQRPLLRQELITHVLLVEHMHEYDGRFDMQIPFCGQGFEKHGSRGVEVDVVLAFVVVVTFALNK